MPYKAREISLERAVRVWADACMGFSHGASSISKFKRRLRFVFLVMAICTEHNLLLSIMRKTMIKFKNQSALKSQRPHINRKNEARHFFLKYFFPSQFYRNRGEKNISRKKIINKSKLNCSSQQGQGRGVGGLYLDTMTLGKWGR